MTFPLQNDNIPNAIVPMILYKIKNHLETALVIEVPETNPTRALLVKVGRFNENPLDKSVSVSISGGDYEDPGYLDGRIDNPKFDDIQIPGLPVSEIGGGMYWWRRGTVNYQAFFVRSRLTEEAALQYAYDFQGRLIDAIENTPINVLVDDYGERAYAPVRVEGVSFFESGGNNQYIWRGKLLWRVLTWRP